MRLFVLLLQYALIVFMAIALLPSVALLDSDYVIKYAFGWHKLIA